MPLPGYLWHPFLDPIVLDTRMRPWATNLDNLNHASNRWTIWFASQVAWPLAALLWTVPVHLYQRKSISLHTWCEFFGAVDYLLLGGFIGVGLLVEIIFFHNEITGRVPVIHTVLLSVFVLLALLSYGSLRFLSFEFDWKTADLSYLQIVCSSLNAMILLVAISYSFWIFIVAIRTIGELTLQLEQSRQSD